MQHLKDLLEEQREELPQYESDACINQFRYRLLKVIEVAGKYILNIFSRFAVERNVCLLFIMACSSHLLSLLNHKKMSDNNVNSITFCHKTFYCLVTL